MAAPQLTFFCELDRDALIGLFSSQKIIDELTGLNASISMGVLDFSPERAEIVRQLNHAGIPLTAWLLLPKDEGYWFNSDNFSYALKRYEEFTLWTEKYSLNWTAIGLDIEPDINDVSLALERKGALFPKYIKKILSNKNLKLAEENYQALVHKIHDDGYLVESYQIPILLDERKARSTFVRRMVGLVDLQVDREVWMLYTSIFRPHGVGILGSYAPETQAIGVGVTGGGVDIQNLDSFPLNWGEFSRDLRLAWYWCDNIYIFSLEGCVEQGFLSKLLSFQWDQPILLPERETKRTNRWRELIRVGLWLSVHFWKILIGIVSILLLIKLYKNLSKEPSMRLLTSKK